MTTWKPIDEFDALRRYFDKLFNEFEDWRWPFTKVAFLPGHAARQYPLTNVAEDGQAFYVEALAPGLDLSTLKITVLGNRLTLEGEKSNLGKSIKPEAFHRAERASGHFIRSLDLPFEINPDVVKAEYQNGLLLITLPKAESAKPKQVEVKLS